MFRFSEICRHVVTDNSKRINFFQCNTSRCYVSTTSSIRFGNRSSTIGTIRIPNKTNRYDNITGFLGRNINYSHCNLLKCVSDSTDKHFHTQSVLHGKNSYDDQDKKDSTHAVLLCIGMIILLTIMLTIPQNHSDNPTPHPLET